MLATIILIIGLLTLAILFVIYVISNANGSGYELYVFRHRESDEYYEVTMFNNKTLEWSETLNIEQYIKLSSVFNIQQVDGEKPFITCEFFSYLKCNKTTASKIRFYIDNI